MAIELTDEERKNGWTEESLAKYLADREKAQSARVLDRSPTLPKWANSQYDPMRWR
jgi:phytoene/squalene synthetase